MLVPEAQENTLNQEAVSNFHKRGSVAASASNRKEPVFDYLTASADRTRVSGAALTKLTWDGTQCIQPLDEAPISR